MKMIIEVELNGLIYDGGYGERDACLVCDVQVEHSGGECITEIKEGTLFIIDQDGGSAGEVPYENEKYDEHLKERAIEIFKKRIA